MDIRRKTHKNPYHPRYQPEKHQAFEKEYSKTNTPWNRIKGYLSQSFQQKRENKVKESVEHDLNATELEDKKPQQPSGRSPVMGDNNKKRDVGLMMKDIRLNYDFDREEDRFGKFDGIKHSIKKGVKEFDVKKTAASMAPGMGDFIKGRDAQTQLSLSKHLKNEKGQYGDASNELFDKEIKRNKHAAAINVLGIADVTGVVSNTVKYGKAAYDALTDDQKKQRAEVSQLERDLNKPMGDFDSFGEDHAKRTELATRQNNLMHDLAINEPKANKAARDVLTHAIVYSGGSHQMELKHHAQVLNDAHGHEEVESGVDFTPALKPSEIRRQAQSEQAIMRLRSKKK